jgi:hypothetical protein
MQSAGFDAALNEASEKANAKSHRNDLLTLPTAELKEPVAFEHRDIWYTEDVSGKITRLDAAPSEDSDLKVVESRVGIFKDDKGAYVYRNINGDVAEAKNYDPSQAGFFKTPDGKWAFRNAWGNIALTSRTGGDIKPPEHGHIIKLK